MDISKILAKKCFPSNCKKSKIQAKITKYGPQGNAAEAEAEAEAEARRGDGGAAAGARAAVPRRG